MIFICILQSVHMFSNIERVPKTSASTNQIRKRKIGKDNRRRPPKRQEARRTQPELKMQPSAAHQRLQSIQKDIDVMKQQVMFNLQQPVGKRDMSMIPKTMQKVYNDLFKQLQVQETEEDRVTLTRKSPFLQINQRFNKYSPETIKALADMSYIWFVYDTIQKKDHEANPESLFLPPDVTLTINGKPHSYSAHDWALSMQKAGFDHPNELRPEVTDATVQLMKPSGTFEAINTALHYGGYLITKATELAWFYAPEQVFEVPQEYVNLQYHSDPYQVYADRAAIYQDYVEPVAIHTFNYIRNPRQAYHDAVSAYHGYVKPAMSMLRRKIFGSEPPPATAHPKSFTPEIARPKVPL